MPLVSIVVPTYQNAAYVFEAVSSALAQTFEDLEVVVSDHDSTDDTLGRLEPLRDDPRLRILTSVARGGGAPRNWERVTREAGGEFIKLLPGDDVLHPEIVERQVEALRGHRSADLTACRRDLIDARGGMLLRDRGLGGLTGLVEGRVALKALVRAGANLLGEPGCVLFRREALLKIGGWVDDQPYLIDQATYMRVLQDGDMVAIPETLASFRISDTQWSHALARQQAAQARAVHSAVRHAVPDVVTAWDVRRGDLMVGLVAAQRRAAYRVWRRRLSHG